MINDELSKYLEFWKMGMCKDETYARTLGPYVDYFKNIFELLSKPLLTQNSNCWKVFNLQVIGDLIICHVPFLPLLVLILKAQLSLHIVVLKTYVDTPFQDLGLGDFIPVRLANLELYLVWMERQKVRL